MAISKYLDPKTDIAFKKVFGNPKNKDILIHFLNDLNIFETKRTIVNVEFLSPIQDPEIESKKQSIVDVLCKDQDGIQYIVEMQLADDMNFAKRAQYYASKAYFGQLDSGKNNTYKNLKEVVFLAITNFVMFKKKKDYISNHIILDKKTKEHDLKDLYFSFIELPKFPKKKGDKLDNIVEKWCYFLKYAPKTTDKDLKRIIGSDKVIKKAYDQLERFSWSEEELRRYDRELKRIMDNASILETHYIKGIEKGKQEGKEERNVEIAKKLLKQDLSSEIISNATGLSKEEIEKLR
jgi:predicted transposase/invertase (TIGR01784 family)